MTQKKLSRTRTRQRPANTGFFRMGSFTNLVKFGWQRVVRELNRRPFGSFLGVLFALVMIAAVGSYWRRPDAKPEQPARDPIAVTVLSVGERPMVTVPATVQKTGVVKVAAQSGGIVQKVSVTPGQHIRRGQQLVSLSTGYAGGSAQPLQRQIAYKSFIASKENLPTQLELIEKRKQIAQAAETQAAELRTISRASLDDTRSLISLNEQILATIDEQLVALESTNVAGSNDVAIQSLKSSKAGVLSGLSALRSGLRATEYQANDDQEPALVARVSRDLTLQQLDLERKGVQLGLEIAELNYKLAKFSESLLYPASPCTGTVERVYVRFGQSLNPGSQIAEVVCDVTGTQAIGLASETVARTLLQGGESVFTTANGATVSAEILAVSAEPTDGPLFSITAVLFADADPSRMPPDASYGTLSIPVGGETTSASVPFVPLDAIYQTQTQSFVYVVQQEADKLIASLREVQLGAVFTTNVEVRSGLQNGDRVILSRSVSAGDVVAIEE